jgi:hypothetical protein
MPPVLNENLRNISAGAAGASFVAITQLATRDTFEIFHLIAIGCFSVALPVLVGAAAIPQFHKIEKGSRWGEKTSDVLVTAIIIFLIGISSILWAFGWYFAVAFLAVCFACCYLAGVVP